jgi:hypothetical protein
VAVVTGESADGPRLTEFSELPYNHLNRVLTLTLTLQVHSSLLNIVLHD